MTTTRRGILGMLVRLGTVATAGGLAVHKAAADEFPAVVPRPKVRFHAEQLLTADALNDLVRRIERLEGRN